MEGDLKLTCRQTNMLLQQRGDHGETEGRFHICTASIHPTGEERRGDGGTISHRWMNEHRNDKRPKEAPDGPWPAFRKAKMVPGTRIQ